ncbi:MAG: Rab geranylgeranyltransferase [Thelocarpon impressellum]|nr:MAG: Rab geranylgeranyltransferase [Thelocarpon impressellum]
MASSLAEYEQNTLDIIRSDLRFLISPLRKFPKCYWIWNHRLWLLQEAKERTPVHASRELWRSELGLVGKMLVLDSRNFHGWSYRRIVASQLESPGKDAGPNGYPEDGFKGFSMVEEEFAYSTKMIQSNLSNFSAWHYRGKLAPRLLSERTADGEARRAFLKEEFEIILSALYTDPDNQSLWSYHEWLMSNHLKDLAGPAIIIDFSDAEKEAGISTELANIRELLEVEDGCKCIYEALIRYTLMTRTSPDASQRDPDGELRGWLRALERLDPLRRGRWEDLKASLE